MTRSMFKNIMKKAHEDQKFLADETSMQVAKVALSKGLTPPNHSSHMEMESDHLSQNSVTTNSDFGLQHIHQLRPETSSFLGEPCSTCTSGREYTCLLH